MKSTETAVQSNIPPLPNAAQSTVNAVMGLREWGLILILAVIWGGSFFFIYFRVLAVAGATNILLVTFLIPVSAIFLGVMVLGERPGWNAFGGMALIFVGLIAIDGRFLHGLKREGRQTLENR